jgi:pimeloyl-ACP methyl ester carboxylesterase
MVSERDLVLSDGRTLHVYDAGPADAGQAVFWHHGTPQLGAPPGPLLPVAAELGVRWVSFDRPAYGSSTPVEGRDVGSVAADVAAVADALGLARFGVMGASGGGPHSLACAALSGERVTGVVSIAGLAPYPADGLDWLAGMADGGAAELRAAMAGRAALEAELRTAEFDEALFTAADYAALSTDWAWLGQVSGPQVPGGLAGMVDDDLAYVHPWGFALDDVRVPTLLVHGADDRVVPVAHGDWLQAHLRRAELWRRPGEGHISVLRHAADALRWLSGISRV